MSNLSIYYLIIFLTLPFVLIGFVVASLIFFIWLNPCSRSLLFVVLIETINYNATNYFYIRTFIHHHSTLTLSPSAPTSPLLAEFLGCLNGGIDRYKVEHLIIVPLCSNLSHSSSLLVVRVITVSLFYRFFCIHFNHLTVVTHGCSLSFS